MNLDDIMLSEINKSQKDKCHLCEAPRAVELKDRKGNGGCHGLEGVTGKE